MRIPNFPTIIRTFYTISNHSIRTSTQYKALQPFTRGTILRSMPTIPFLSSFFSTSNPTKMSYPVQKSDDEWQAVLSKGTPLFPPPRKKESTNKTPQNNSASSEKKVPKRPSPANTTSTCPPAASTPAPPAMHPSTKHPTNSSPDADGQHTLTISPAQ